MNSGLNNEIASKILARVVDQTAEIVVIVDDSGFVSFVNPAFCQLTGFGNDEIVGRRPYDFISLPEDTQFLQQALREIQIHGKWKGRLSLRKKSGQLVDAYLDVLSGEDDLTQAKYYIVLGHDLAKEQDLQHQMEEVQRLETVGSLANGIAHHFNNVLASIVGQMELLLALEQDSKAVQDRGQKILDASKRGQEVVKQLMTFCRKTKPEQRHIDIAPIVRNALKMVEKFYSNGVSLEADIPDRAPAILATAEDINQIVINLLTNAIEAINVGNQGGMVTVQLSEAGRSLRKGGDGKPSDPVRCLKLAISDTGIGMDETVRKQLFDPFFTTKNRAASSGMGLTVTHSVVKRHRGVINVLSVPNEGSTFEVYFPILPNESIILPSEDDTLQGAGECLFFFDSDPYVRESGGALLKSLGYDVYSPISPQEVNDDDSFDLMILGITGGSQKEKEWAWSLAKKYPATPLLLLYPLKLEMSRAKIESLFQATSYLAKPCPTKELSDRIKSLLAQKKDSAKYN